MRQDERCEPDFHPSLQSSLPEIVFMLLRAEHAVPWNFDMAEKPASTTPRVPGTPTTPDLSPGLTFASTPTTEATDQQAGSTTTLNPAVQAQPATAKLSSALGLPSGPKAPPKAPAQPPEPILQVKLIDNKIGFRVFALRSFAQGEPLYRERIMLEATHHLHPKGVRNAYERYMSLPAARRDAMHGAFPALAAANHVNANTAASSRLLIGSQLLGGVAITVSITPDQHRRMRRPNGLIRSLLPRNSRKATLEWFRRYAFRLNSTSTMTEGHNQAGVYLLTGLLNHRCAGYFNCRVVATVDEIKVVAHNNINSGDELTLNYGTEKTKTGFSCRGPCCRRL